MEIERAEELANMIDAHCRALLKSPGTQKHAIQWMKTAFNLLEECAKDLRRPRIFATHSGFGCATYSVQRPVALDLRKLENWNAAPPPVWVGGTTVPYGDKYQNRNQPWTQSDTRKLVAQRQREKAKLK